jgi:folate-binding protein YgfZ
MPIPTASYMTNIDLNGVCPLPHLGVIRAQGEEAAKFLHGQLTQDLVLLADGQARLAAYCSPKGRMLASFVVVKRGKDDILLVCQRDLLVTTLKRLSMFVMRAKVRLSDATEDFALFGLAGNAQIQPTMATWSAASPAPGTSVVQLFPCGETGRQLWVALKGAAEPPEGTGLDPALWAWSEVASGVATVGAATSELFVPQMLNFESVGGVNFKKGCYPGQEVVARSQFRGTLKRRTFLAIADDVLQAGQEIFAGDDAQQPVGLVVQTARRPEEPGCIALLCLQTVADASHLRVGDSVQGSIRLMELPYTLLEDV